MAAAILNPRSSDPESALFLPEFGQHGQQKPGCGFPVAHLLTLFHAGTGFLLKVLASPLRTHDMKHAAEMHPELEAGDVLIAACVRSRIWPLFSGENCTRCFACTNK